jgi:hypothetical protein
MLFNEIIGVYSENRMKPNDYTAWAKDNLV